MRFERIEYVKAEMEQAPQRLTIDAAGNAHYESHSNAETPDHPEIGIYETVLPRARVEGLSSALDNPPFSGLPDHWGQVMPSDHYRRIRLVTRTETIEKLVGTRAPVDPNLRELIRQLDEIAAEVARHPRQTLRLELAEVSINSSGALTGTLTLSNSGVEPTAIRNPASMIEADDARLFLQMWPDKPPSELRATDTFTVNLESVAAAGQSSAGQPVPSVITLQPAASVSFRINGRVESQRAGVYVVRAFYTTTTRTIEGNTVIIGELFSRMMRANIP